MPLYFRSLQTASCAEQGSLSEAPSCVSSGTWKGPSLLGGDESATLGGTYSDAPRLTIGRKQSGSTQDAASARPRAESTALPAPKIGKTLSIRLRCGEIGITQRAPEKRTPITAGLLHPVMQVRVLPAQSGVQVLLFFFFHQLLLGGLVVSLFLSFPFKVGLPPLPASTSEGAR